MVSLLKKITRNFGYELMPIARADELYFSGVIPYLSDDQRQIIDSCRPFTQTSRERIFSLICAVDYVVRNDIAGALVECGVWKGGSAMVMARQLELLKESRDIYLFDTFTGMPPADHIDIDLEGNDERWYRKQSDAYVHAGRDDNWNAISLEEVKKNLKTMGPTRQKFHFIEGKVEQTLPAHAPASIALLRLDTDFFSSTTHELIHLFPRLIKGGVLIIDDYGHFLGARKAVDQYFLEHDIRMLMHRIDYTAVIGIKL